jgi:hypothetical protein
MAVRSGGQAPYAPPQTVLSLISQYRNRALPTPFTKDVLTRAGVPDSLVARTLQTFRLLDLINEEGNPTPELEGLRRAGESELPQRIEAVIRTAYADVLQFVDPATEPAERVRDVFRHYEPLGQLTRIVTLFLGLCAAAGMIPEQARRAPATTTGGRTPRLAKKAARGQSNRSGEDRADTPPAHSKALPPIIDGALATLPRNGDGWTKADRKRWFDVFTTVVDFSIPIREEEEEESTDVD